MLRLALVILCLSPTVVHAQRDRPPNIVLIIGGDHGYTYFGFTGSSHVHTPNLDALAARAVVFHLWHTTSNHCRPALQALMTGLYPVQYDTIAARLRQEEAAASADYQAMG